MRENLYGPWVMMAPVGSFVGSEACPLRFVRTAHKKPPIEAAVRRGPMELEREGDRKFSWSQIAGLFNAAPVFLRYGFPVVLLVVLAVSIGAPVFSPEQNAALMTEQAAIEQGEQYSPAELYQALQDLNLAIEYLNKVGQRTEVLIGDRFLVTPLQDALNASFERAGNRRSRSLQDDPLQNDPI
ncbi:MAG: hypothetical protein IIC60_12880 [Proteobacteria bacterium]|nr:hypothetical protein [Pseudomonadota bacterium]